MTEAEWFASTELRPMLDALQGKVSIRKLNLFACACGRELLALRQQRSLEVVPGLFHRFLSGLNILREPNWEELLEHWERRAEGEDVPVTHPVAAALFAFMDQVPFLQLLAEATRATSGEAVVTTSQVHLLRDVVGNPFRPPTAVDPAWLAWHGGTVTRLAGAIYDARTPPRGTLDGRRLAVLADALEEAGCDDAALLAHCRGPGDHVRGCWVVDALTGRS